MSETTFRTIRLTTSTGDTVLEAKQPTDDQILHLATFEGAAYAFVQAQTVRDLEERIVGTVVIYRERPTLRCGRAVLNPGDTLQIEGVGMQVGADEIAAALDDDEPTVDPPSEVIQ